MSLSLAKARSLHDLALAMERAEPERKLVFGEGAPDAQLVLVGEAPGAEEERTGRPFAGQAGTLLDRLMAETGIRRSEVWITNVVKHRPVLPKDRRSVNRSPTQAEIERDLPWLRRELAVILPRIVLCLGSVAANAVIHEGFQMTGERGRWFVSEQGALALATYHPAYVRRFGPALVEATLADFRKVRLALS